MKNLITVIIVIVVMVVAAILIYPYVVTTTYPAPDLITPEPAATPLTMTVAISGRTFSLINGVATIDAAPDASSRETVRVFGDPIYGDLDNDGDSDAALLLQYSGGGTGMFYYAIFAMYDNGIYKATNTLLLGDRIAPQTIEVREGRAVYNFADRAADEPMSVPASIGRSVWLAYNTETQTVEEWVLGIGDNAPATERYAGTVDRVAVVFEHQAYTAYRLITNGVVREGELNTERGFGDDADATVYVLNWQAPVGEQLQYVRFTDEPTKLYLLDSEQKVVRSSVLTLE